MVDDGDKRWADAALNLTGGRGSDRVVELVSATTWRQRVRSAAPRGRLVVIGSHAGLEVPPT